MTGSKCILDTTIVIHAFRNDASVIQKLNSFEELYISATAVGELYYGAFASANPHKHIAQIEAFLSNCVIIPITDNAAIFYGRIKSELKKNGTLIPENDIWIAAVAVDYALPLFTTDKHFSLTEIDLVS